MGMTPGSQHGIQRTRTDGRQPHLDSRGLPFVTFLGTTDRIERRSRRQYHVVLLLIHTPATEPSPSKPRSASSRGGAQGAHGQRDDESRERRYVGRLGVLHFFVAPPTCWGLSMLVEVTLRLRPPGLGPSMGATSRPPCELSALDSGRRGLTWRQQCMEPTRGICRRVVKFCPPATATHLSGAW